MGERRCVRLLTGGQDLLGSISCDLGQVLKNLEGEEEGRHTELIPTSQDADEFSTVAESDH